MKNNYSRENFRASAHVIEASHVATFLAVDGRGLSILWELKFYVKVFACKRTWLAVNDTAASSRAATGDLSTLITAQHYTIQLTNQLNPIQIKNDETNSKKERATVGYARVYVTISVRNSKYEFVCLC